MKASTMLKSAAALAVAGTAAYLYNAIPTSTKRKMRRTTGKAIHSLDNAVNRGRWS